MIIYIDVLLVLNLYINYFMLRASALFLKTPISPKRCLLASAAGAVSSLTILSPALPFAVTAFIKAVTGVIMVLIAFGRGSRTDITMRTLTMLLISFAFSGLMLALYSLCAPLDMAYSNGIAYFDIPISAVVVLTIIAYCMIKAIRYLSDKKVDHTVLSKVSVTCGTSTVVLNAYPDTGNRLCDPFSARPVIICKRDSIESILPQNVRDYLDTGIAEKIKLAPCSTVTSQGLIPVFAADSITINNVAADAMIGVCTRLDNDTDCIFNPKIIT